MICSRSQRLDTAVGRCLEPCLCHPRAPAQSLHHVTHFPRPVSTKNNVLRPHVFRNSALVDSHGTVKALRGSAGNKCFYIYFKLIGSQASLMENPHPIRLNWKLSVFAQCLVPEKKKMLLCQVEKIMGLGGVRPKLIFQLYHLFVLGPWISNCPSNLFSLTKKRI